MTHPPEPIVAAAVAYARRGWLVLPMGTNKKPTTRWRHRTTPVPHESVAAWFADTPGTVGVGLACGKVSGDLYVRDFDKPGAYEAWAAAQPELARTLPTVRTSRGWHVYARWPSVKTRALGDGELRGEKVYVVAPPSPHPSGCRYRWHVPLPDGPILRVDPLAAGLALHSKPGKGGSVIEKTEPVENVEALEPLEFVENTEAISGVCLFSRSDVQGAIMRTLPTGPGTRNQTIFGLARELKAIPDLAGARANDLRPLVKEWHTRALPNIGTRDFATSMSDFIRAWPRVHTPAGSDPVRAALERAEAAPCPAWALDYGPKARLLASLCRELARQNSPDVFFLSCAKAGACIGVDQRVVHRWLGLFVADGAIGVVSVGTKIMATRFRYRADDLDGMTGDGAGLAPAQ